MACSLFSPLRGSTGQGGLECPIAVIAEPLGAPLDINDSIPSRYSPPVHFPRFNVGVNMPIPRCTLGIALALATQNQPQHIEQLDPPLGLVSTGQPCGDVFEVGRQETRSLPVYKTRDGECVGVNEDIAVGQITMREDRTIPTVGAIGLALDSLECERPVRRWGTSRNLQGADARFVPLGAGHTTRVCRWPFFRRVNDI